MRMATLAVGLGLALAAAGAARADFVALSDVPQEVRQAGDKAAPGVEWLLARDGSDDGGTYYVLLGKDRGDPLVQYWGRGTEGFVRVEVTLKEVPQAVRDTLKAKAPDLKPDLIQHAGLDTVHLNSYRFQGTDARGNTVAVLVSEDGKKVIFEK
jgi:hypothetical protein